MKTKIVIITNMPSFYRVDLFNRLTEQDKYDINVIFCRRIEKNLRKWDIDEKSFKFNYLFLNSSSIEFNPSGINEKKIIYLPGKIVSVIKSISPEAVISFEYNPVSLTAFFHCKTHKIKYISWSDGTIDSDTNLNFIQYLIRKLICPKSDALIASSSLTKESQIKYGADPRNIFISLLTINGNQFTNELNKESRNPGEIVTLITVSYLFKRKGIENLLNALKDLNAEYRLLIIGDGPEKENLSKMITAFSLDNKVILVGYKNRTEIIEYFRNSDGLLFPTLLEQFGLVTVEALFASLPLIISKYAGSINDVLIDSVNGYMIDPYNKDDMISKIEKLIKNKELRESMRLKSLEISKKFDIDIAKENFLKAIDYVLD